MRVRVRVRVRVRLSKLKKTKLQRNCMQKTIQNNSKTVAALSRTPEHMQDDNQHDECFCDTRNEERKMKKRDDKRTMTSVNANPR